MRPFSLLIKPAGADCNLRCTYCFYLGHCALYPQTHIHRMPLDVLEKTISSYMSLPFPEFSFSWQGGEPTLMGLDFFKKVTDLQQKYGRSGAVAGNGLQTNTTLIDDSFAAHLHRYSFLVGVSLDGPRYIHDTFRTHADGRGSYEEVMRGIEALKRNGVEFNILVLVNSANVGKAQEVYEFLCDNNFLFHQYIPCVEFAPDGSLYPFAIDGEQWGSFLCDLYDIWTRRGDERKVSVRLFDSIVHKMVTGGSVVCTMARDCRQYFAVEHNGDVYPCDFFVEKPLLLGNVMNTSWDRMLESEVYRDFGKRKAAWNTACSSCQWLDFCAGDCQKNRFDSAANPSNLSVLCNGWKRFFDHAMGGLTALADEIRRENTPQNTKAMLSPEMVKNAGRNDPCPCGSGLKFKRCCMGK